MLSAHFAKYTIPVQSWWTNRQSNDQGQVGPTRQRIKTFVTGVKLEISAMVSRVRMVGLVGNSFIRPCKDFSQEALEHKTITIWGLTLSLRLLCGFQGTRKQLLRAIFPQNREDFGLLEFAIQKVVEAQRITEDYNHLSRRVVLFATLNFRNTFNSARWKILQQIKSQSILNKKILLHYLRTSRIS